MEYNQTIESASIFCHSKFAGEYYLSVSNENCAPNDRHIIWAPIKQLKNIGVSSLNLGCGVRPGDKLCDFKRRFGGARTSVFARKRVHNEIIFNKICSANGCDPDNYNPYFPPYQNPNRKVE